MALILMLISLVLCYFSPGEVIPLLAPYHIQQLILLPSIALSLVALTMRPSGLPAPHYVLMAGLWFAVITSQMTKLWIRGSFNSFMDFGIIACVYFLVIVNASTPFRARAICITIALCAVVMGMMGILAYHTGFMADDLLHEMHEGETLVRIRGLGILNDANDFAQFLLVGLALLGAFWKRKHFIGNVTKLIIPAGIIIYAVYLTGSRAAIFGLAVIVFSLATTRVGKLQSVLLAGFVVAILIMSQFGGGREISLQEGSAAGRVMAWGTGISMLKSNPLFGIGFEKFEEENPLTAHNSFVLCFAELGLFGYFFWLAMVVTAILGLQKLLRAFQNSQEDDDFSRCVTTIRTALYTFLVTSWFLSRTYNITLYVLLALAAAVIGQYGDKRPETTVSAERWIAVTLASQAASIAFVYATVRLRGL
jgi:putative inorganic carbon (HCO3(-)) transporter